MLRRVAIDPRVENQCGYFERNFQWRLDQPAPTHGLIVQRVTRWFGVHQLYQILQAPIPLIQSQAPRPIRHLDWLVRRYMSAPEIDNYVRPSASNAYATEVEYWEAWYIPQGQQQPHYGAAVQRGADEPDDTFSLCGIAPSITHLQNTTRGRFILQAEASYHPIGAPRTYGGRLPTPATLCQQFGLAPNGAQCAGILPSSTRPPQGLPDATQTDEYTIVVRWDASVPDGRMNGGHGPGDYGESKVTEHAGAAGKIDLYW